MYTTKLMKRKLSYNDSHMRTKYAQLRSFTKAAEIQLVHSELNRNQGIVNKKGVIIDLI